MSIEFPQIGIQCTKKKDIEANLEKRKKIKVDPFRQKVKEIDLNAVKLCFQENYKMFKIHTFDSSSKVFLAPVPEPGSKDKPHHNTTLAPICSNPIFNKHAENLKILDISDNQASVVGNKKIIILTEKLPKPEDIAVRFSDQDGWEDWGCFESGHVHKQVAITLKVPEYVNQNIKRMKKVSLEIIKMSDNGSSESVDFYYTPLLGKGTFLELFIQLFTLAMFQILTLNLRKKTKSTMMKSLKRHPRDGILK